MAKREAAGRGGAEQDRRREAVLQSEHAKRLARRVVARGEAYTKEMRSYFPDGAEQAAQWLKRAWTRRQVLANLGPGR